jgi:hypothetical protein
MEQKTAIKFCVEFKETAIETFEMLESAYGEEHLWRTSVFEWHKIHIVAQTLRMQKSRVKIMMTAFFYAKGIIHHEFVEKVEKQSTKFTTGKY